MKQHFMLTIKLTAITCEYGNSRILMKSKNISKILQKWIFYCNLFMVNSFLRPVMGASYLLEILQTWLFPQLHEGSNDLIFQQDGAPPHWHNTVWEFLNHVLPQCWTQRLCPTLLISQTLSHSTSSWKGVCERQCFCSTVSS